MDPVVAPAAVAVAAWSFTWGKGEAGGCRCKGLEYLLSWNKIRRETAGTARTKWTSRSSGLWGHVGMECEGSDGLMPSW